MAPKEENDTITPFLLLSQQAPDKFLELVANMISSNPETEADPVIRFFRGHAYRHKGANAHQSRGKVDDEILDLFELSLKDLKYADDHNPSMNVFKDEIGGDIRILCETIDRHRPGKVKEILGDKNAISLISNKQSDTSTTTSDLTDDDLLKDAQRLLDLANNDPDKFLELLKKEEKNGVNVLENPGLMLIRATAYIAKAQALHQANQSWEGEPLKLLDLSLLDFGQIYKTAHSLLDNGKDAQESLDSICKIVSGYRPGRVQEVLGKTKLKYLENVSINTGCAEFLIPSDKAMEIFTDISFNFPVLIRSAFVFFMQKDDAGRHYIRVALYTQSDLKDAFGEVHDPAGWVDIYNDGTYILSEDTKKKYGTPREPIPKAKTKKDEIAIGDIISDSENKQALGLITESVEKRNISKYFTWGALGIVAIVSLLLLFKKSDYQRYLETAKEYYQSGRYDEALGLAQLAKSAKATKEVNSLEGMIRSKITAIKDSEEKQKLKSEYDTYFRRAVESFNNNQLSDAELYLKLASQRMNTQDTQSLNTRIQFKRKEQAEQERANKENEAYDIALKSNTAAGFIEYLRQYPNSTHSDDARLRLNDIRIGSLQKEAIEKESTNSVLGTTPLRAITDNQAKPSASTPNQNSQTSAKTTSLSGSWTITITVRDSNGQVRRVLDFPITFSQRGKELNVRMTETINNISRPLSGKGRVNADDVQWSFLRGTVRNVYRGRLIGDTMSGTLEYVPNRARGPNPTWKAVRR